MSYPPGTRIRFPRTIIEPANGDHPEFQMATAGDEGVIVSYNDGLHFNYEVRIDSWPQAFGVRDNDFDVLPAQKAEGSETDESTR